jgi:hypothetical protein
VSAAGRGPRLGGPEDFYATPAYCVDRLLDVVEFPGGIWVEPGAGSGSIIRAVGAHRSDITWTAIEIREEEAPGLSALCGRIPIIGDFLADPFVGGDAVSVVIGNPPYSLALEFINRALALFPGAYVAFLLRLNFAASRTRAPLMRRATPDVYVLPDRPSFRNGKTDATEYAWFVWPPDCNGRSAGIFRVLATTDKNGRGKATP